MWKWIFLSLGLLWVLASLFILSLKLACLVVGPRFSNTRFEVFGSWSSSSISVLETEIILELPFFDALMVNFFLSQSMSVHCNLSASFFLAPVS